MLKHTKIELAILNDYNQILIIKKGTRCSISKRITRYTKANNKYIKNYNPKEKSNYLMYLDANSLYGYAMVMRMVTIWKF